MLARASPVAAGPAAGVVKMKAPVYDMPATPQLHQMRTLNSGAMLMAKQIALTVRCVQTHIEVHML